MKILLLWPSDKEAPAIDKYVDYCPIKAAYMDDEYIPALKPVLADPYIDVRGRKRLLLAVIESIFYSIPYVSKQEGEVRTMRSVVRLRPPALRDFTVEIVQDPNAYAQKVAEYAPDHLELSDVITTEKTTTDEQVDLFYYPKEVVSVIENW